MNKLGWNDIKLIGRTDNAGRWYPSTEVVEYFYHIRSPSRAWPHSYAKAAQTKKFAQWLFDNKPELATKLFQNNATQD
jgi:hypothetical protein